MATDGSARSESRGIFAIGRSLVGEVRTLVRQEIELAKQEMIGKIVRDLKAAALLIVAGVVLSLALFVFIFMLISDLFSYWTGHLWLGLLITWAIYTVVFGIIAYIGFKRLVVPKPERTIETLREDVAWAKQQLKRSGR